MLVLHPVGYISHYLEAFLYQFRELSELGSEFTFANKRSKTEFLLVVLHLNIIVF